MRKSYIHLALGIAVIASTLYWAQNCGRRSDNQGDLKTLDNFAAGKRVKTNNCSGDPALAGHDGLNVVLTALQSRVDWDSKLEKSAAIEALNSAFSAVPADIQNMFLTLNGRVLITDRPNEICTDMDRQMVEATSKEYKDGELKALQEDLSGVSSCYLFGVPSLVKRATGKNSQLMTIVISAEPKEIRHSLVRSVGYLVSNVFSHLIYSSGDKVVTWISEENPNFTLIKDKLAAAFLKDIQGSQFQNRFTKYLQNGTASNYEKKSFGSFVYAEAFDSFYCNSHAKDADNTRKVMETSFPNSFMQFAGVSGSNEIPKKRVSDSELKAAESSIDFGAIQTKPNLQFQERLFVVNWLSEAAKGKGKVKKKPSTSESGKAGDSEGFGLGGGILQAATSAWNSTTSAVTESVQGAGILYSDYSNSVQKSVQKSFDQTYGNNSGLKSPTISGSAMAVVNGVSGGTGYSEYYNQTQESVQKRVDQGQGVGQAAFGGVSDSSGYTAKYNQIQKRTDNIARQVMSDPNYNTYSPGYQALLSTSVVTNAVVDDVRKLPKVGDYAGAAQDFVKAGSGGGFNADGNYVDYSTKDRVGARVSGLYTTGDLGGVNKAVTGALTERGMTALSNAEFSDNKFVSNAARKIGDGVVFGQSLSNAYEKAAKSSEVLESLETIEKSVELGSKVKERLTGE